MPDKCPLAVKRSYKDGHIRVQYEGRANGYGASITIKVSDDIQSTDARSLAAELIRLADETDAKVAKETAAKARRAAWVDREVAAGRMQRFSAGQFMGRTPLMLNVPPPTAAPKRGEG